jgi:hypothetical protein
MKMQVRTEGTTTMAPVSGDRQARTPEEGTQQTGQQDVVEKSKGEDKDNADMKKLLEFAKTQGNNDSCRIVTRKGIFKTKRTTYDCGDECFKENRSSSSRSSSRPRSMMG